MPTLSRDALAAATDSAHGFGIRIEGVEQDFGSYPALRDVSLDIAPGELVALLGPSGSGKTTLLRVIAGLNTPDRGAVYFGDEHATNLSVQERRVGFVFQNYALFKHMTVADNIAFDQDIELVVGRQSGGQRQRAGVARALAADPGILLFDEPFGALDARVRKDLRRWLREIHKKTGLTTVFVTHDQDEAMELADRVVVLNQGRIEQVGPPEELYDHPASPFVISFVGEAVALPVKVVDGHVEFGGRELHVDTHGLRDGAARVFFRPADIAIGGQGVGDLEGRVESLRRTAGGVRATIAIDGYDQTLEIDSALSSGAKLGGRIPLSFSNARIFPSDPISDSEFKEAGDGI